jgi:ATP-binding cassette, subfamily C, bacterial CydC
VKTIRRLLHFLKPISGWVALSVLLSAGTIAANIGLLGTSAYLITQAATHPSIAELNVAIVGVRFFGIARSVLRYLERLTSHSANFRLLAGLRTWFFQKMEPLAPARLIDQSGGDLLGRVVSDIEGLEDFYVRAVAPPITALVVTLGMGLILGINNLQVGAILLAGLAISGIGVPWLAYRLGRRPGMRLVAARAEVSAGLVDGIQGLADLVAFGQEDTYLNKLRVANATASRAQRSLGLWSGLVGALNGLTAHLTLWWILFAAIGLVRAGGMEGVTLAVITLVTLASFEATQPLGQASQRLQAALAAAARLFEIADLEPAVAEPAVPLPAPAQPDLKLEAVSFQYQAESEFSLRRLTLDLPKGKHIGLVGPSGAGKSTLVGLLERFWEPAQGKIWLDGHEIREYASPDVRRQFAVIGQNPYVFHGTVQANLLIACPAASVEALERVLRQARLWEWVQGLPNGLETWIGEHGAQISGGERQRLAIARALLQDAPVWLLDEPTTHLDERSRLAITDTLWEAAGARSLIWISHELSELARMDEILVLKDGLVIERGTPQELSGSGGWFSRWQKGQSI